MEHLGSEVRTIPRRGSDTQGIMDRAANFDGPLLSIQENLTALPMLATDQFTYSNSQPPVAAPAAASALESH